MTPKQLAFVGNLAFGKLWQTQLAKSIGVTDRLVRYWAKGHHNIPEEKVELIFNVAYSRSVMLDKWCREKHPELYNLKLLEELK